LQNRFCPNPKPKSQLWWAKFKFSFTSRLLISLMRTMSTMSKLQTGQEPYKQRIKYKIEFPPGPMGLELEPVIKSSERELGCRVKDFYFSIDHDGVDQKYIEDRVSVGDIVCSINGEDIRSLPFISIVEKLRLITDCKRIITFKNITASCKTV
jgi:hypothetical protein